MGTKRRPIPCYNCIWAVRCLPDMFYGSSKSKTFTSLPKDRFITLLGPPAANPKQLWSFESNRPTNNDTNLDGAEYPYSCSYPHVDTCTDTNGHAAPCSLRRINVNVYSTDRQR